MKGTESEEVGEDAVGVEWMTWKAVHQHTHQAGRHATAQQRPVAVW